jgi:hypothetical protein
MGKKISAPSHTMSDKESSVRSRVFIEEGYKRREQRAGKREWGIGSWDKRIGGQRPSLLTHLCPLTTKN